MSVNHGGGDILMPKQRFYGSDVVSPLPQMGRNAVAQGRRTDSLLDEKEKQDNDFRAA